MIATAYVDEPSIESPGPQIFRRLWSAGRLGPQDVQALARLDWATRAIKPKAEFHAGNDLCLLASGLAVRQRFDARGAAQMTSIIIPGDPCSYAFLTGSPHPTGLRALTDCRIMQAPLCSVVGLFEDRPDVAATMLSHLAVDTATTEELVTSVNTRSALERTAHFLCEMEYRLRRMGLASNGQFTLAMTQAEIGNYLGLSAVHVNRTLQELRRRGALSNRGTRLTLDVDQMHEIAGFRSDYLEESVSGRPQRFDA